MSHPEETDEPQTGLWPSYDEKVDEKWASIIPREELIGSQSPNIPDPDSKYLVKPSYSLKAINWILWAWPPFTTMTPEYGETADTTNGCTLQQFEKLPLSAHKIFTSDRIWRRFQRTKDDPKPYERTSPEFQAVHKEFIDFLWEENQSPVVLLLGHDNVTSFPSPIVTTKKKIVAVTMPGPKLYKRKPNLWLIFNTADKSIERIVIPSYHPEMVFRGLTKEHAVQMDWAWNLMAAIGEFSHLNQTYFQWKSTLKSIQTASDSVPNFTVGREGPLSALFEIVAWENTTGEIVAVENLPTEIKTLMNRSETTWPEDKSIAAQLLDLCRTNSRATQAAQGYPDPHIREGFVLRGQYVSCLHLVQQAFAMLLERVW